MTVYEPADWRPEPGEVAEVTHQFRTEDAVFGTDKKWHSISPGNIGALLVNPSRVRHLPRVDPASMVVLDPESETDVNSVADAIRDHHKPSRLQVEVDWLAVQAALRSLLPVVTPPEPNGLGAVVLPADSSQILQLQEGGWHIVMPVGGDVPTTYKADARDRVLSHGVGCSCGAPDCNGGDQ